MRPKRRERATREVGSCRDPAARSAAGAGITFLEQRLATGGRGLVVCTRAGGPTNHRNATRMFDKVKPADELTYHQLRHNFASALIAAGADVVYVFHQLGHASPSITMDIYAHEFKAVRERGSAAKAIDAAFGTGS